ncbi:MAG: protein translocase subunit SecD [Pyrinomonadaceae bacterium]|nr:protein translocase subunit SecD [Pyrinomonadaceae bacterium]
MKKKNLLQRVIIILIVTLASLYIVVGPRHRPTRQDFTWSGVKNNLRNNIRLGLDLRGGAHLVMRVKTEEYLKKLAEGNALAAEKAAKDKGLPVTGARADASGGRYSVVLETSDASKLAEIRAAAEEKTDLGAADVWSASTSGNNVTWSISKTAQSALSEQAVEQAMKIIDSRLNATGVVEPVLQRHGATGSNQILLQMPGIEDPERVKKLMVVESKLELVHVISPPSPAPIQEYATEQEAVQSLGGTVPTNRRVVEYAKRNDANVPSQPPADPNAKKPSSYVVVESPSVVDGSELRNASAVSANNSPDDYQIQFSLKPTGAQKFGTWTAAHINEYMGVLLNDKVESIAYIKSQISDSGEISGNFTKQSADDLALTLRSGALPAPIQYQEERTVGPSLGADSIRSGVTASLVGLILVVLFMVFYYKGSGLNAMVALLLNMLITLAAMVLFGGTMTLPGIAGLILTIGMTVDTNVLIFERIREELQTGKTVASAVEQGFARAFVTVIDTHVTTIVSSMFLFVFGTGPIRGFAVTLVLGLLANLFSAVYVSRTIFIWLLNRKGRQAETISI